MSLRVRLALTVLLTAIPLALGLLWLRADMRRRAQEQSLQDMVTTVMRSGGRQMCERFPEMFSGDHAIFGPASIHVETSRETITTQSVEAHRVDPESMIEILGGGEGMAELIERMKALGKEGARPPMVRRRGGPDAALLPPWGEASPPELPPEHYFGMWAYHADLSPASERTRAMPEGVRAALAKGAATASEVFGREGVSVLRMGIRMPWDDGACAVMVAERALPSDNGDRVVLWGLLILCGGVLLAVLLTAGPIVRRIRRLKSEMREAAASGYARTVEARGGDEIADLARTFNEAGEAVRDHIAAVESREATLRRFVADTTHDVMTPLTVLQGHLAGLRQRAERGEMIDPNEVRASLEEAHYMGSLIHNLDAVAKLEAAPDDLTNGDVDLDALVGRVVDRHRPIARARGIEVEFSLPEDPVRVSGDVTLLEQAVSNVVHNAVRYNEDGGHVSVRLESSGDRFTLRVLDDGPGVEDEHLLRLAERRFRSAEARTRRKDGRGIGLAIASDVAARHGLTLSFCNLDPHGLEAAFEGPRAGEAARATRADS